MTAFYNEIDPYAAEWLRNLIAGGHIAPGVVDRRSIVDLQPADLVGYRQCHFFAGIGGWSYAARLAGWPDDRPLWTGSCPCQPFSVAGAGLGVADPRHLWPDWFRLIRQCRPAVVFGEQVAAAIRKGWLDLAFDDLESEHYACAARNIPACAVRAPHLRARVWFVADADGGRWAARHGNVQAAGHGRSASASRDVRDTDGAGLAIRQGERSDARQEQPAVERTDWWAVEPSMGRVAHGVPARVGKLRALGNAIVPQVAAEVIAAYMAGLNVDFSE